ncbi:hypothetical protein [Streptacidiphilus monticola]|uniref:Molecular chaperone DnaJ n=1 Tax=Streptacidiphilus monticola TaxID=2161674 RepID=A0ABW1FY01_9ACTN
MAEQSAGQDRHQQHEQESGADVAGGSGRWWRGEGGRAEAQAAREAAAQAFYELDTLQRDLTINVETLAAADTSEGSKRAQRDFAAFGERINHLSEQYINALDAVDLDAEDLSASAAGQARRQLDTVRQQLLSMKGELDRFASNIQPLLAAAENQLAQVVPAVERAKQAWLAASNTVDAAKAARLKVDDQAKRLAGLAPQLKMITEGAGRHGVQPVLRTAAEVQRTAEQIRAEAERLPQQAAEIDRTLASLRTRAQALETRAGQIDPVLSELRRRFSAACWQDLQHVPQQAADAVRSARARIDEAEKARNEQRWNDASLVLGNTRTMLNTTDASVAAVHERLAALNEVQRDADAVIERARFAVRDAQRLAMAGRSAPDPRHAQPLDAAVARIDRAAAALTGRHPDYWALLTELNAAKETAATVVRMIREERSSSR